jgi:hypothetical protein
MYLDDDRTTCSDGPDQRTDVEIPRVVLVAYCQLSLYKFAPDGASVGRL